jgi:hypothetical protein
MKQKTYKSKNIGQISVKLEKIIYESEMNSIEYMDWTIVCNECLKETEVA